MKFTDLKFIIIRLYNEYVKKHLNRIMIALILSILVAGSTSAIAWLLDPAVKKIFIENLLILVLGFYNNLNRDNSRLWLVPTQIP